MGNNLSLQNFKEIVEELLGKCNSNAFILVNQPGIRAHDFTAYKKDLINLQLYMHASSTAVKFEQVDILPVDMFDELIDNVKEKCNVDEVLEVDGNNTDSFQPYIDTRKRIIRIDFPELPQDSQNRSIALSAYDKSLRAILAQLPSPELTIVYASLKPDLDLGSTIKHVTSRPVEIFPEIFLDPSRAEEVEKNDRILNLLRVFNEYHPKFKAMSSQYISIFEERFITENFELIRTIITVLTVYLIIQVVLPKKKPKKLAKKKLGISSVTIDKERIKDVIKQSNNDG